MGKSLSAATVAEENSTFFPRLCASEKIRNITEYTGYEIANFFKFDASTGKLGTDMKLELIRISLTFTATIIPVITTSSDCYEKMNIYIYIYIYTREASRK